MQGVKNRNCAFKECLTYYDGQNILYFNGLDEGELSTTIRGIDSNKKWSDLWYVFIPYGYNKTLAQMNDKERKQRIEKQHNISAIEEFADYYHMTRKLTKK